MNLDRGLDVLLALAEDGCVGVPMRLARVRRGDLPDLPETTAHGFSVYVGVGQGWQNSSVFLAVAAKEARYEAPTNGLVRKQHRLPRNEVGRFLEEGWIAVEGCAKAHFRWLSERGLSAVLYASWIPPESRYSFISQIALRENHGDLDVWFDHGNSNGWDFKTRGSLRRTNGILQLSKELRPGGQMAEVPVDGILDACSATAFYVKKNSDLSSILIEGKVTCEGNKVMLIDVYEGPRNDGREPVTHDKHLELLGLPPRRFAGT